MTEATLAPPASLAVEVTGEPTSVYRLYGYDGALLYVGITANLAQRWADHANSKPWWPEVTRKTVVLYGSRREAELAEGRAIRSESPVHNKAMGRRDETEPRRPAPKLPPILRQSPAETRAARSRRPETFTLGKDFLTRIDAYADNYKCSRDAAFADSGTSSRPRRGNLIRPH